MPDAVATATELLSLYRVMKTIRGVENSLSRLFADGEIPGFIHLSVGQEAVASGVCSALRPQDTLATTHRGHGHVLARGLSLSLFFKEVMGKAGGVCGGRGGSMHVADMGLGILGANGIVGASLPIALGSALAHQTRQDGGVAVAFFGDGAMAEGVLHETLNMAALWHLPLILVCENNGWSEFSPTSAQFSGSLERLAAVFGIRYERTDGNDAVGVAQAAGEAVVAARAGQGPSILECLTHRVRGHYEGDPQKYRPAEDLAALDAHDPLARARARLLQEGTAAAVIDEADRSIDAEIAAAIELSRQDAEPSFDAALRGVYA